jgi:type I restriction enzyme R subunit
MEKREGEGKKCPSLILFQKIRKKKKAVPENKGKENNVFALCGLKKPNISLLSDEFLEDIRQVPYRNLAVELLEKLIKDNIKAKTRNNIIQEKKFADRLQNTLRKYNNRAIETAQVIEELIQMAKDFQTEMAR